MSFSRLLLFLSIAALLLPATAVAGSIELTDIRTFSVPFGTELDAVAINDHGDIAGTSGDALENIQQRGFVIPANGASPVEIIYPDSFDTFVYGINNHGVTVGFAFDNSLNTNVGFTEKNGSFRTIQVAAQTYADGINNRGDVTGYFSSTGSTATGFLIKDGVRTTFSVPGYSLDTYPTAINDWGQIAGYYDLATKGFLRNADGSLELFDFPALALNDAGIIVGTGPGPNDTSLGYIRVHGVTYTYEFPGATAGTYLYGINNHDEVVGFYGTDNGYSETIFVGKLRVCDR